jgi:N-glycosylase/DNA lyase
VNAEQTILSGQVFLWEYVEGFWYGIDGDNVLKVDDTGVVEASGHTPDFFRNSDDMDAIRASLAVDPLLKRAMVQYPGLRITRQDFAQCVISFVVSANSNIPRIRRNLQEICRRFGDVVRFDGREFRTFPSPEVLAGLDTSEIRACGTGYRAAYVRDAARAILEGAGPGDLPYHEARRRLCEMPGVGSKVADCILLFSCGYLEAFPLDRWLVRTIHDMYGIGSGTAPHSHAAYDTIHDMVVERLGPYAGYAQQYLFKMARDTSDKPLRW